MRFLFDTNIIIGFLKNEDIIVNNIKEEEIINVSVITVGEMFFGANNSERSDRNTTVYKEFFEYCEIFKVTEKTAEYYAKLRYKLKKIGKPIPENDIWIAAIAKENDMTIVTRDKHLLGINFIKTVKW